MATPRPIRSMDLYAQARFWDTEAPDQPDVELSTIMIGSRIQF